MDKTVYKITKGRSPQKPTGNDESFANSDANNLSIQFEKVADIGTQRNANKAMKPSAATSKPVIEPVSILL